MEPMVAWYSGCEGWPMPKGNVPSALARMRGGGARNNFVVLFAKARREPTGAVRDDLLAELEQPALAHIPDPTGVLGDAHVYRVR